MTLTLQQRNVAFVVGIGLFTGLAFATFYGKEQKYAALIGAGTSIIALAYTIAKAT